MADPSLKRIEEFAFSRYPKRGHCPASCFADGATHRVGTIPALSLLDGAAPGDVLYEICLECGQVFGRKGFIPKRQPNRIGGKARARGAGAPRTESVDKYHPELLSPVEVAEFELMFTGVTA